MRIVLHIGTEQCGAERLQTILSDRRAALTAQGIRYASAPGKRNHTRLWMAVTDPDHVDPLRYHRGYGAPARQQDLRDALARDLAEEVREHAPDVLMLSASQLCWLSGESEVRRLRDLLVPLSGDIRVVAHVDEQARVMARLYAAQVFEGRAATLDQELSLAVRSDWWDAALKFAPEIDPRTGDFAETQAPPFWLDYGRLIAHWERVFGPGTVRLRASDGASLADEIRAMTGSAVSVDATGQDKATPPAAAWLSRGRQFNEVLRILLRDGSHAVPRPLWRSLIDEMRIDGPSMDPGSLAPISRHFAAANAQLLAAHPDLAADTFEPPAPAPDWQEAEPGRGFRATQYLLAFMWRIEKATRKDRRDMPAVPEQVNGHAAPPELTKAARDLLPAAAQENFASLRASPFAPHNRMGQIDEAAEAQPFLPAPPRPPSPDRSGNVIVGCMKNEAPYILEWIAYHRAIGVDGFLIYTNGCEDGTDAMLDRLQALDMVQHRRNDDWKGKSPQQHALNLSLGEPVIAQADWIIHIDVDEFINVRCGNGTLADLFAQVPEATNIAMTWRLFGHNGVRDLEDALVIEQFDRCAPQYCPKPHTVWGFKTMSKNIGAYAKLSCHRPNKLQDGMAERVAWVNGSGRDMTREAARSGWRNSRRSIGYDLVQLNHYALRSAESFLIKRQRGRALHVDRTIGLNYWIRMDWCDHRDLTIMRNVPRVRAEMARLLADPHLADLHRAGLAWHRAKAAELRANPEFAELFEQALQIRLTGTERAAYALALDMES